MVEIVKVESKKQIKEFIEFPLKLYKGNPYFVPPLYGDEKSMFKKDYHYRETKQTARLFLVLLLLV